MTKHWKSLAVGLGTGLASVVLSQACGDAFTVAPVNLVQSSSVSPTLPITPSTVPTPAPTPAPPVMHSWSDKYPAGVKTSDCMTNPKYNLCLVYKDPVTASGGALSPAFTPQGSTQAQEQKVFTYGLIAPTSGAFANDNFTMELPAGINSPTPTTNGDWKYRYNGDANRNLGQLNTWYWMNRERDYFIERTGQWHASKSVTGKTLVIRPLASVQDNAYFDPSDDSLNIGYSDLYSGHAAGQVAELNIDIATIAHELGHGDFFAANSSSILGDSVSQYCFQNQSRCCPTTGGCPGAIHEGQADFHAKLLFPDTDASIMDLFFNNPQGDPNRDLDLIQQNGTTANQLFNLHASQGGTGEIHDMGTVYASIWYGVWKAQTTDADRQAVETLFISHLSGVGGSDTFLTAFSTIKTLATQLYPSKADNLTALFKAQYARMGLTVN